MCSRLVSDNLLVAYIAPSNGCRCPAVRPPVAPLDLPTTKDLDVTTVVLEKAKETEIKGDAASRSLRPATTTTYTNLRKTRNSTAYVSVGRNHVHWILAVMLAFFSFTMLEVARSTCFYLLGCRYPIQISRAADLKLHCCGVATGLQFGPDFLSLDQSENFEAISLLGDAAFELGWISIATSLWLTASCLDSVLSGIIPNDSCSFLNPAGVEFILTSTLAGAWISRLIHYWGLFQLIWTSTTISLRTEWMVYSVSYMAVCITSLLLLNAIWVAQAALTMAREQGMSLWVAALYQVNDLARYEDDQEGELLEDAEEGFVNYDQYLYWDKR
ncbi:hypothetical protein QFC22_000126 [Naganishia vaughanmartiniae]|uniref:Uncharacterized protein n=1 Tax=Naganishia vaughanmartiniae TaxID=1424756 RepID=A0ACC2XPJ2_9TREE|nr:hypothetical protein QFC22_000126 [Naganishia vaughanmartiniae]